MGALLNIFRYGIVAFEESLVHSTEGFLSMSDLYPYILLPLEANDKCLVIFFDVAKTFDTVWNAGSPNHSY